MEVTAIFFVLYCPLDRIFLTGEARYQLCWRVLLFVNLNLVLSQCIASLLLHAEWLWELSCCVDLFLGKEGRMPGWWLRDVCVCACATLVLWACMYVCMSMRVHYVCACRSMCVCLCMCVSMHACTMCVSMYVMLKVCKQILVTFISIHFHWFPSSPSPSITRTVIFVFSFCIFFRFNFFGHWAAQWSLHILFLELILVPELFMGNTFIHRCGWLVVFVVFLLFLFLFFVKFLLFNFV